MVAGLVLTLTGLFAPETLMHGFGMTSRMTLVSTVWKAVDTGFSTTTFGTMASVLQALEQGKNRHPFLQLAQRQHKDQLLYYRDRMYVPELENLRVKIIRQYHDNLSAGYPGRAKTFELLPRNYLLERDEY